MMWWATDYATWFEAEGTICDTTLRTTSATVTKNTNLQSYNYVIQIFIGSDVQRNRPCGAGSSRAEGALTPPRLAALT